MKDGVKVGVVKACRGVWGEYRILLGVTSVCISN